LENEFFQTAVVQQRQKFVCGRVLGCFSVFVVNILQISIGSIQVFNGCFAPTYTTRATGLLFETPILLWQQLTKTKKVRNYLNAIKIYLAK
jgi:hypothetical protein